MAARSGNTIYVTIGGTNVSAYWTTSNLERTGEEQDITRGSGTTDRQRALGLKDTTISLTLSYDDSTLATYVQKLAPGIYEVEYGPEGNVSGKPRHVQSMLLTTAPFEVAVEKPHSTFQLEFVCADVPSVDMYAGAVYS